MWHEIPWYCCALIGFFAIASPAPAGSAPPDLTPPNLRAVTCGADVAFVDVTPVPGPNHHPESVTLEGRDPIPIDLTGWTLHVGRRRTPLDGHTASFDVPLTLASPPLRNRGGEATLVDPCGITIASVRWGSALDEAWASL